MSTDRELADGVIDRILDNRALNIGEVQTLIERALASARAEGARKERERMAQLAQDAADNHSCGSWDCHVDEVVAAIRARGTE